MALLVPSRHFRASRIAVTGFTALLLAAPAPAQENPPPKSNAAALDLAQAAEARSNEWSTLASGMEQRVARLLPCDPRVRAAVEEVSRASDVRYTALIAYWQDAAAESQEQAAAANKLSADTDARVNAAKEDSADAEKERAYVSQQFLDIRKSAAQLWSLSDAVNELGPIALAKRDAAVRAAAREKLAEQSKAGLTEVANTAEARQRAIEKVRQTLTTEGNRWREYYAARITRAQIECQLTGPAAAAPAPRPSAGPSAGKKGN